MIVNFCAAIRKLVLNELPSFAEQQERNPYYGAFIQNQSVYH